MLIQRDMLIDRLYDNFKNEFNIVRDFEVYFKIDFPILFSFSSKGIRYLVYVLTYKRIKQKLEFIITEVSDNELFGLLNQEETLLNILTLDKFGDEKKVLYCNKTYNRKKELTEKLCISDNYMYKEKLPRDTFKFTKLMPNEINISEASKYIEHRMNSTIIFISEVKETEAKLYDNVYTKNNKFKSYINSYNYNAVEKTSKESKNI